MCHQSVGLIARHIEAAGIPTVMVANMRVPMQRVKPPRVLLTPGPRGRTIGDPGDRAGQVAVVRQALRLLEDAREPGAIVQAG